jgi:hypothetical protein
MGKGIYIQSTLSIDLILLHTQLIVCAENVRSWFKSWVFLFTFQAYILPHGLRTPREEIAITARPKIQSQSQIFRYGRSIFCLPHRPNFSDIFDSCLQWVCVVHVQEQIKKTFCYQKLFWASTVWINCSSDFKKFENSRPSASNFKKKSGLLEWFFLIVGQNNFGNKIPFLSKSSILQSVPLDSFVHTVEICFSSFYYFPTLFYVSLPQILH